jgi:D-alanyl-D-alanine dipeptidase
MLCARFVRGSTTTISNHSWGTAIDLTLDGVLDRRGDGRVQVGLTRIAPIFKSAQLVLGRRLPDRGRHAFRGER